MLCYQFKKLYNLLDACFIKDSLGGLHLFSKLLADKIPQINPISIKQKKNIAYVF